MTWTLILAALAFTLLGVVAIVHGRAEYQRGRCDALERERQGLVNLLEHGTTGQTTAPHAQFSTGTQEPEGTVVQAEVAHRRDLIASAARELLTQARESGVALTQENAYLEAERVLKAVGAV